MRDLVFWLQTSLQQVVHTDTDTETRTHARTHAHTHRVAHVLDMLHQIDTML